MNYPGDIQAEQIEDILKDPKKQALSNAEASYLLHDSYKKKTEFMEKKRKQIFIHPVFMDFLDYIQKFPNLKYTKDLDVEDIEPLKEKLSKFKRLRNELEEFEEIDEIELVQLWNLCPATVEEAISWVSSLERFQESGKEIYLKKIIEVIHKYTPIDPRITM